MNTIEKLDKLSDLQAQEDVIRLHYADLREKILTPEIQQALKDLDAEKDTALTSLQDGINQLTAEIKTLVLVGGSTVKGQHLIAVWVKGRVSWDTKGLEGYKVAHPEIATFRKEGDPSVTIRSI
jgi:phage-related minor tail protein